MAVKAKLLTDFGEERELYVRLNNFDQLANHGVPAIARFRGYVSKEAFENGSRFVWEQLIEFDGDAPDEPWKAAYAALKAHNPTAEIEENLAKASDALEGAERDRATLIEHLKPLAKTIRSATGSKS
jgi:hypothetical protein